MTAVSTTNKRYSEDWLPTRRTLLSRLRRWDDADSWRVFFETYGKLIYGFAIKSGLTDVEAQEVVQETIIEVSKKMPGFKYNPEIGSFKGWLAKLTKWRISDRFRQRQREAVASASNYGGTNTGTPLVERVPDPAGADLEAVWDREWEKNLVDAAIARVKNQVNPKHYQIFDLYVLKQWPLEKITQTLGVNMGQVYLAKHRVTALIKKEIKHLEDKLL